MNERAKEKYFVILSLLFPEFPPSILKPPKIDILNSLI